MPNFSIVVFADANDNTQQLMASGADGTVAKMPFSIGEIVWCKIRGSVHWPARILSRDDKRYNVLWLNDYRTTKVFETTLFKFHKDFEEFAQEFSSNIGLKTAAKEAIIYLARRKQ